MHGGIICSRKEYKYAGKLCCNDCVSSVRQENEKLTKRYSDDGEMSEGEYQAYGHMFD
jgi:hypothetical protein